MQDCHFRQARWCLVAVIPTVPAIIKVAFFSLPNDGTYLARGFTPNSELCLVHHDLENPHTLFTASWKILVGSEGSWSKYGNVEIMDGYVQNLMHDGYHGPHEFSARLKLWWLKYVLRFNKKVISYVWDVWKYFKLVYIMSCHLGLLVLVLLLKLWWLNNEISMWYVFPFNKKFISYP